MESPLSTFTLKYLHQPQQQLQQQQLPQLLQLQLQRPLQLQQTPQQEIILLFHKIKYSLPKLHQENPQLVCKNPQKEERFVQSWLQ